MDNSDNKNNNFKTVFEWPPLESDPQIFTNYLKKLGLNEKYKFDELYGLDEELLLMVEGIPKALIINYEKGINKKTYKDSDKISHAKVPFYMYQQGKLDNACGVIAALHAVGNNKLDLNPDSILDKFFKNCTDKLPEEICANLQDNSDFKNEHKSFASKGQSNLCDKQEDVKNHFVCFAIVDNNLIEFDGVIKSPMIISSNINSDNFLIKSCEEIKKRLYDKNITDNLSILYLHE